MISDIRGGEKYPRQRDIFASRSLIEMRMQVSILTASASQEKKRRVSNKKSSWHPGCITTRAHVHPWTWGTTQNPTVCDRLSSCPQWHRAGTIIQGAPCRGVQQGPQAGLQQEMTAHLLSSLQVCTGPDVPAEMHKCLQDVFSDMWLP